MDKNEYLWFCYLNCKLDFIIQQLEDAGSARLVELKKGIDAKAAELKAAVDANTPK